MKKIVISFLIVTLLGYLFISCNKQNNRNTTQPTQKILYDTPKETTTKDQDMQYVYVCSGAYATKYHYTPNCTGLNNCRGDIEIILEETAKKIRKTICEKCYKKYVK